MPHGKAHDSLQRLLGRESPASPRQGSSLALNSRSRPSVFEPKVVPVLTWEARWKDTEKLVPTKKKTEVQQEESGCNNHTIAGSQPTI